MIVTIVKVRVKPGQEEAFARASEANHEAALRESGNRRFDVLQSAEDPASFVLYEAYDSPEAAAAHKETAHYKAWREAVADMMAEPRSSSSWKALRPV